VRFSIVRDSATFSDSAHVHVTYGCTYVGMCDASSWVGRVPACVDVPLVVHAQILAKTKGLGPWPPYTAVGARIGRLRVREPSRAARGSRALLREPCESHKAWKLE
jgi:hypothetical protein